MNKEQYATFEVAKYLKENGYAKSDRQIADAVGVSACYFSMATRGDRVPSWNFLLDFCDKYPINFWWIRDGKGSMLKGDTELLLLGRIKELENEILLLTGQGV